MALYDYPKFKIRIAPDSKKHQGLRTGDVVRRQYTDGEITRYSLMVVLDTGTDTVAGPDGTELSSPYFIGALLEGDEPRDGELLDFIRTTSLTDQARSGAMYLTASDTDSPYMDAIDGMVSDNTLCHPTSIGDDGYGYMGECLDGTYKPTEDGFERIFTVRRNGAAAGSDPFGIRTFTSGPAFQPQRLLISFYARASKVLTDIPLSVYHMDRSNEGTGQFNVDREWSFHLLAITLENSPAERSLRIDLSAHLTAENDTFSMAGLNVIRQDSLGNFSAAMKVRVGRISGIADPLFGVLNGYGAYFQNLYATRNVNVAGTLTAGDEQGFASTFYVGRIHKNCLINSLSGNFKTSVFVISGLIPPTGIGQCSMLMSAPAILECQSEAWSEKHAGELYCFSFYAKSNLVTPLKIQYNGKEIGSSRQLGDWNRCHVVFRVEHIPGKNLCLSFVSRNVIVASFQLEPGDRPTLYQPTDAVLNETNEYGAWFSRGGIGGTIQNPLLRLEADGSIHSANGSFVINADGTGHFAGGKFRWTKDTIDLKGVTLRWEDFDEDTQEVMLPKSVSISGGNAFHYADALIPEAQPETITLVATEQNFIAESRRWEYFDSSGEWKDAGGRDAALLLRPDFHAWEERELLTMRYVASYQGKEYTATFTVAKLYDGESAYSVYIDTDRGTVLQNGIGEITLTAHVMRGACEVTDHIPEDRFLWTRQSDDSEADDRWNAAEPRGRMLTVDGDDVSRKAVFNCEILLNQ